MTLGSAWRPERRLTPGKEALVDFGTEVREGYGAAGRRVLHHMRAGGAHLAHLDACHAPPELQVR